jgi:polyphosphate glucokinase
MRTLSIDIGGTGIKAIVLDLEGAPLGERERLETPKPAVPAAVLATIDALVLRLGEFERVSIGFPGVVQDGVTRTAPNLDPSWAGFALASQVGERTGGKPVRVLNDAAIQGLGVIEGKGFEVVITLGTGFGTAFFMDGSLMPHIEFSHLEFRKGETFNEQIGEAARKNIGDERWNKRVRKAIAYLDALAFFDHLYIGGGNGSRVNRRDLGEVLERITVVDNKAGILGGIKLWEAHHVGVEGVAQ